VDLPQRVTRRGPDPPSELPYGFFWTSLCLLVQQFLLQTTHYFLVAGFVILYTTPLSPLCFFLIAPETPQAHCRTSLFTLFRELCLSSSALPRRQCIPQSST